MSMYTRLVSVIRKAIDKAFPSTIAKKRAAWRKIREAPLMPVPDTVEELKAEIAKAHEKHLD